MNVFRSFGVALATGLLFSLSACGGGGNAKLELVVHSNDQMQFEYVKGATGPNINVKVGQPIHLVHKNIGKMPIAAMGHNFCVLKQGVKALEFGAKCLKEGGNVENGYLPDSCKSDVIEHTKLLGPGEEDEITFQFDEPGIYEFVCTYAGHAATMKGKFAVQ
jgi:azurin